MSAVSAVVGFLIAISIIVLIHEGGHYLTAKLFGIRTKRFSIGMGRVLWKFRAWDTEFAVSMLPIGGYVSFDEAPEGAKLSEKEAESYFKTARRSRKAAVAAAGPAANFVLAFIIFWMTAVSGVKDIAPVVGTIPEGQAAVCGVEQMDRVVSVNGSRVEGIAEFNSKLTAHLGEKEVFVRFQRADGYHDKVFDLSGVNYGTLEKNKGLVIGEIGLVPWSKVKIASVAEGSAAEKAGIRPGDVVEAINTQASAYPDFIRAASSGKPFLLTLRGEDGSLRDASVAPQLVEDEKGGKAYRIGVSMRPDVEFVEVSYSLVEAIPKAFERLGAMIDLQIGGIASIFKGEASAEGIAGPVGIADMAGGAIEAGAAPFIEFIAVISVAIGIMNLIPIPALDGGQLVILMIESIRGRSFADDTIQKVSYYSFLLLLALAVFATFNDVGRILG